MKKILFAFVLMLLMGIKNMSAQNYEIVYSMKMNPESIVKMLASETGMPEDMMSFLKDDIKKAKIYVSLNLSKDKSIMKFLKDKSKFEINMMGMKMDGAAMFNNAGINTYCDYSKGVDYTIITIEGKTYMVDGGGIGKLNFKHTGEKKTIMGHECRKMTDSENGSVVWYAVDIPYTTKMYPGVPGVVLEMSEDTGGFTFTAISAKPTSEPVEIPKNAKKVSKEYVDKMLENIH